MRERWIVALAVFYYIILLGGALFISFTAYEEIERIPRIPFPTNSTPTYPYPHSTPWPPVGSNYTVKSIPVIHNDTQLYYGEYKPYVTSVNITAQDYHANMSGDTGSLYIQGFLNNTGGGVAYDLVLHVIAMNAEGKAIDANYELAGITSHMGMGIGQSFNYNGTALTNCTLTPTYMDKVGMLNQAPSNNASALPP
jgi:hypothetical protein